MTQELKLPDNKKRVDVIVKASVVTPNATYEMKVDDKRIKEIHLLSDHIRAIHVDGTVDIYPYNNIERFSYKSEQKVVDKSPEEMEHEAKESEAVNEKAAA